MEWQATRHDKNAMQAAWQKRITKQAEKYGKLILNVYWECVDILLQDFLLQQLLNKNLQC